MKKKTLFLLLCALTALMLLMLPVIIPSGSMLGDYQDQWAELAWDSEALRSLFLPEASAEEAAASLPTDLMIPGNEPNPDAYTENGYEDDSISVRIEKITDAEKKLSWTAAYIKLQDPSQFRTCIAGNSIKSERTASVLSMAKKYNAVIAVKIARQENYLHLLILTIVHVVVLHHTQYIVVAHIVKPVCNLRHLERCILRLGFRKSLL